MNEIVDKIVALGVPGLVLLIVINSVGVAGAAALTASLATLGGPFGMLGGIAVLLLISTISGAIAKYGFEEIFKQVALGLKNGGHTKDSAKKEIDGYWFITDDLKMKMKSCIDTNWR